jgi:hypothetical protein
MIKTTNYKLNSKIILSNEVLNTFILKFWEDVFTPLIQDGSLKHLMVLCKVKYSAEENELGWLRPKTLAPLRKVEFNDLELFSEYLQERLGIIIESYNPSTVSEIIFTYVIKDGKITGSDRALLQDLSNKELPFHNFNKISLPVSMNPEDYGSIRNKELHHDYTRYIVSDNKRIYEIDVSLDRMSNKVTILGLSDFKWIDTKISDDCFKREIGKSTIYFLDGEMIFEKQLNAKSFRRLRSGKRFTD